jgi:type IV secretory pathway VirB10-like protein
MKQSNIVRAAVVLPICLIAASVTQAQTSDPAKKSASVTLARRDAASSSGMAALAEAPEGSIAMVPLTVPRGTPLQIALDREIRVRKVGQPIEGRVMQPVYAFDKLVVPAGTKVTGQISAIEPISRKKRFLSLLDADLTPSHKIQIEFDNLLLPNGGRMPVDTTVEPGSGQVIQLVTAGANHEKTTVKDKAEQKIAQEKQQASQEWHTAMQQVKAPGKKHRLMRCAMAELPIHPQYINAGTLYFAELDDPLAFGSEPLTAQNSAELGQTPPPGSLVHALLLTPLNSGTTQKGASVEAVISQPLFDGNHRLVLPEGSRLKGNVVQVEPARHLHHPGELRLVFHQVVPPDGMPQEVAASFEGVQSAAGDHVQLDSEGGARATNPKSRYLDTSISLALAAFSSAGDGDTDALNNGAGGANTYRLIGFGIGFGVHYTPLGMAMGAFGASRSIYSHFLSRGQDVVFPKDTAMEIGFGPKVTPPAGHPIQQ